MAEGQSPIERFLSGTDNLTSSGPSPLLSAPASQGPVSPVRSFLIDEQDGGEIGAPEPTGAAFRFLETLRIPQAALFSGVIAGTDPNLGFGEVFAKRPSFEDVMNAGGIPEFYGRGVIEFAGDVITDPLNLIPAFGLGSKALRVAGSAGFKGIRALERVGLPGLEMAEKGLTRAFRGALTAEGRAARQMATQAQRYKRLGAEAIQNDMLAHEKTIRRLARELNMPADELGSAITARVEARMGAFNDLSVEETLISELVGEGAPIFNLKDDIARLVRDGGEFNPQAFHPLSEAGEQLVAPLVSEFKENAVRQLTLEAKGGVRTKTLAGVKDPLSGEVQASRLDYIMHLVHPDARKELLKNKAFAGMGRSWNPSHASLLARELRDVSISELNTLAMKGQLAMLNLKKVPLFIDNPAALDALRAYRGARAIASAKLFDDITAKYGELIAVQGKKGLEGTLTKAKGVKRLPGESLKQARKRAREAAQATAIHAGKRRTSIKGLENVWFEPEVADVLDSYFKVATGGPSGGEKFMQTFQAIQNGWKAWTLAIFPEYHTRNIVGNVWNNYLAGMGPAQAKFYRQASNIQSLLRGEQTVAAGAKASMMGVPRLAPTMVKRMVGMTDGAAAKTAGDFMRVGKVRKTVQGWLDEMAEGGVMRGGIFGGELDMAAGEILATQGAKGVTDTGIKGMVGKLKRGTPEFLAGRTTAVRKGMAAGQMFEDNARVAHYLWKRSKGASPSEAAASVKKFLFNYDELDPFTEQMRKVIPFLTWTRFNVPLQLEHLIVSPQKVAGINKFRIAIESAGPQEDAPDERFVADWVRENMGIRVRRTGKNDYDFFLLENWIPMADLSEIGLPQLEEGIGKFSESAGKWATGLLTPFITVPVEFATGKSLFFDRDFLPERREFLGADISERWVNALRAIRVLSVIDRFVVAPKGVTLGENITRTLTGIRITPVDLKHGRRVYYGRKTQRERELASAISRALDNGRVNEANRLERELMALKRER